MLRPPAILISEFHFFAVFKCFDPLVVWHSRLSSGEISISKSIDCSVEIAEGGTVWTLSCAARFHLTPT
jgi:hypothetical protein